MKMVKTITLALLIMPAFLVTHRTAAMELAQPKEKIIKIKSNPILGSAFLLDTYGRESLIRVFCIKSAASEPFILVSLQNPEPLSATQINDLLKKFEGADATVINEKRKYSQINI